MRKIFTALISCALTFASVNCASASKKDVSISCLVIDDLSYYDVRTLQNTFTDYSVEDSRIAGDKYYFNLCSHTLQTCPNGNTTSEIFAYKKNEVTGLC